jgi:hypothetical protein
MGKIIFWIVVIFAVLFAIRLWNAAKAKRRADETREKEKGAVERMVRCQRCGVYIPRADALVVESGYVCGDAKCRQHS